MTSPGIEQGLQSGPPQSMSVSIPFLIPSMHEIGSQTFMLQVPLVQSMPTKHI